MKLTKELLTSLLVLVFSAGGKAACAAEEAKIYLRGTFVPFSMSMASMSVANQVAFAEKVGFTGLGLPGMVKNQINQAVNLPQVVSGRFKIPSVLWYSNVHDTINVPWLDSILTDAKKVDMAIWMVSGGNKNRLDTTKSLAISRLRIVAERCRAKGVRLVLYPHLGTTFETAEEGLGALDSLRRYGYSDVRLSIHLCHEVKYGNGARISAVVAKVAPYLALASVNGADSNTYRLNDGWATAIMPLDAGTYDARIFLRALSEAKYSGPIELHTYGLKSPTDTTYDKNIERSFLKWNEWVTNVPPVSSILPPPLPKIPLQGDLVAFSMSLAGVTVENQIAILKKAGYTGVGFPGLAKTQSSQLAAHPDVVSKKFKVSSLMWYTSVYDRLDTAMLDSVLPDLRKMGASLLMVSGRNKERADSTKSRAVSNFAKVASRCQAHGVQLVVYPHLWTVFEGVEGGLQALDSLRRRGHPEVRVAMDLSHEFKMGNASRIPALVAKAAPFLGLVFVNGGDIDAFKKNDGWVSAVKPLGEGTYDVREYLAALSSSGFTGVVQLQTSGLKNSLSADYDQHLEKSLAVWSSTVLKVQPSSKPSLGFPFVPFGMNFAGRSVTAQVEAIEAAGFRGIGLPGVSKSQLTQISTHPHVVSGGFKVPVVMWYTSVYEPLDTVLLDSVLPDLRKMGASLWMVSGRNKERSDSTKSKAIAKFVKVADRCRNKGVELVVYPHIWTVFEGVVGGLQAMDSLKRLGHPEVRMSLDLSHELKIGNAGRIPELVTRAAPYLGLVAISGGDVDAYSKNDGWASSVKPLDQGSFELNPFLMSLAGVNYRGPILLQTAGLTSPFDAGYDNHLQRSLARWQEWVDPSVLEALPDLKEGVQAKKIERIEPTKTKWRFQSGRLMVEVANAAIPRLFTLDGREIQGTQEFGGIWVFPSRGAGSRILRVQGPAGTLSTMVPAF